jgi:hypothetical protein
MTQISCRNKRENRERGCIAFVFDYWRFRLTEAANRGAQIHLLGGQERPSTLQDLRSGDVYIPGPTATIVLIMGLVRRQSA